jgi:predicted negative regulator of RcsB-dependent stress response
MVAYDAFVSYSHAHDKPLAAALQSAMQRLGKAWYRRRALRLFRDDTSLSATPELWRSIEETLGQSRFLILIASPEAAASPWVDKEVAHWLDHNGANTLLIALTDGELAWDGAAGDFRRSETTSLPPTLKGRFVDEPFWVDLRAYRDVASPRDAKFVDLAANFAATIHGVPKEDLLSQEVRQQRRALRLAWSAVASLIGFLALAGWQWRVAESAKQVALAAQREATEQQKIAEAQRDRAEHTLTLATQTANGLVFDLAQKFRDAGVPVAVIADILERARKLQDQLATGGETSPDLRRSQAEALVVTGDTLRRAGDIKGALTAITRARDIFRMLLATAPDSTYYQRELSISGELIGDVLQAQGDLVGALATYRDALAILKTLTQKDPGNAGWQHDLSVSDNSIGDVLEAQGDLAGALAAYRDSLAIRKALVAKDPSLSRPVSTSL